MLFLTYWFVIFAGVFFVAYWLIYQPFLRLLLLLGSCLIFQMHFAGPAGVLPIFLLAVLTYVCGLIGGNLATTVGIVASVLTLASYKYLTFLVQSVLGLVLPEATVTQAVAVIGSSLPAVPPLGISFFVFEFCHYLFDVRRGQAPLRSPLLFASFALFWPTLVAGPIKRYEQFTPSLEAGLSRRNASDIASGLLRVAEGLVKKFIADYLGQIIDFYDDLFNQLALSSRWGLVGAIALRILFDFSGYSDIAIGYARMMGVRIPENFWWPYLAVSPVDFWRRWHISLSSWVRDYVYIPLGGNRYGPISRVRNLLVAFLLVGLWHGAGWNFIIWGLYQGVGVAVTEPIQRLLAPLHLSRYGRATRLVFGVMGWLATMLFVALGWLLFFYPLPQALEMARALF